MIRGIQEMVFAHFHQKNPLPDYIREEVDIALKNYYNMDSLSYEDIEGIEKAVNNLIDKWKFKVYINSIPLGMFVSGSNMRAVNKIKIEGDYTQVGYFKKEGFSISRNVVFN